MLDIGMIALFVILTLSMGGLLVWSGKVSEEGSGGK